MKGPLMSITLDDLREKTRKKFAPVEVELKGGTKVVLRTALRLGKEDRKIVSEALSGIGDIDTDADDQESLELIVEKVTKVFNIIADKPAKLLKELDDPDLDVKVMLMTGVLSEWITETQLGEASNSPDS